ncbi:MAG: hypothetical protein IMW89_20625, partial [Ktedonobacteraceae bacterium]|nr:hypothetical protein [Ktedonobacteraceae bacterium]
TLGVVALWLLAVVPTLQPLRHAWQHRPWSSEERREVISHTARLVLLATAALTLLLYVISPDAALFPVATSRYLVGLLVSLPAVLWPLWNGTVNQSEQSGRTGNVGRRRVWNAARSGLLLFTGSIFLLGTFSIFTGFPPPPPLEQRWGRFATQVNDQHLSLAAAQALNRRQHALIINLQRAGIYHIYSDYWTCNRLIFQSRERIICGVVIVGYDRVKQGQNRYAAYYQTVRADPRSAYVFESGSPDAKNIALLFARQGQRYRQLAFDGYMVYQPLLE